MAIFFLVWVLVLPFVIPCKYSLAGSVSCPFRANWLNCNMAKYENKTKETDASVTEFIDSVDSEKKREDAYRLLEIMGELSGEPAKMWGKSIIGFGSYHYKYESGHEGDSLRLGFSPRKAKHSLYLMSGFDGYEEIMSRLGKYKTGKSCLYINKLADVDEEVLKELILASLKWMDEKYPRS